MTRPNVILFVNANVNGNANGNDYSNSKFTGC